MKDTLFSKLGVLGIVVPVSVLSLAAFAAVQQERSAAHTVHVTGSGIDQLNGAIEHSKQTTPTGVIQRSTATVELNGDLHGRVLYHVTSVFDYKAGTLVNTGDEVFSGTVNGSEPVMLHDSKFRFDENLNSGEDRGSVYLVDHIAGPRVQCTLHVVGTGKNQDGNPTFNYSGECSFPG